MKNLKKKKCNTKISIAVTLSLHINGMMSFRFIIHPPIRLDAFRTCVRSDSLNTPTLLTIHSTIWCNCMFHIVWLLRLRLIFYPEIVPFSSKTIRLFLHTSLSINMLFLTRFQFTVKYKRKFYSNRFRDIERSIDETISCMNEKGKWIFDSWMGFKYEKKIVIVIFWLCSEWEILRF